MQVADAVDSIRANISEGFRRYHYQENKHFCYFARGSLFGTITWIQKAMNRKIISEDTWNKLIEELNILYYKLNAYIKLIGKHNEND